MITLFMTEIYGIQNYLFSGGKLKDMVAASDMLDQLWSEPYLGHVLSVAEAIPNRDNIIRKAGGAFYAVYSDEATARRLKILWLLFVAHALPGARCVATVSTGETLGHALETGQRHLQLQRHQPIPTLPQATPLTLLSARTKHCATKRDPYPPENERIPEAVDAELLVKRYHFHAMRKSKGASSLERKFCDLSDHKEAF